MFQRKSILSDTLSKLNFVFPPVVRQTQGEEASHAGKTDTRDGRRQRGGTGTAQRGETRAHREGVDRVPRGREREVRWPPERRDLHEYPIDPGRVHTGRQHEEISGKFNGGIVFPYHFEIYPFVVVCTV